ncbi:hypothetical protein ACFGWO_02180 [Pasteurella multocida]|uniref:hypothetical protein n=1 Tax=Pasteurella multocida TaxID=747 RepID=UPI002A57C9C2|nr:hypothetical protein [Pasteurella multocida]MDY0577081.1 hypothetical protein [Pasteurella multocida]MEB3500683.1 hypothetical protein [Pasteurella multocida]
MKQSGKIGNKNAVKEVTASSQIQIRVQDSQKELFRKTAEVNGLTMSKWFLKLAETEILKMNKVLNIELNGKEVCLSTNILSFDYQVFDDGQYDVYFTIEINGEPATTMAYQKDDDDEWTFEYGGNDCTNKLREELENVVGELKDKQFEMIMRELRKWADEFVEKEGFDKDETDGLEHLFSAGQVALNNVSVAVYKKDDENYVLRVEDKGKKVSGYNVVEISVDDYENLPHDPYDNLVRYYAAMNLCEK